MGLVEISAIALVVIVTAILMIAGRVTPRVALFAVFNAPLLMSTRTSREGLYARLVVEARDNGTYELRPSWEEFCELVPLIDLARLLKDMGGIAVEALDLDDRIPGYVTAMKRVQKPKQETPE
jgi:hypothetical protein